ncbi:hypothetical protein R3P38DRAFT_3140101 [Favolaschia claudopus]|uniref:Uncharacterized protein n=1 Tax=Favolaschia claudopus TaxID=2862362 RepID=A0AAV9Z5E3_9AGAR
MPEDGVLCLICREMGFEKCQKKTTGHGIGQFKVHTECCARPEGNRQTFSMHVARPDDPTFIATPVMRPRPQKKKKKGKKGKKKRAKQSKKKKKKPVDPFLCQACYSPPSDEDPEGGEVDGPSAAHSEGEDEHNNEIEEEGVESSENDDKEEELQSGPRPDYLTVPAADYVNDLEIEGRLTPLHRGKEVVMIISNDEPGQSFAVRVNFGLEGHCFWMPTAMYRTIVSKPTIPRGQKSRAYEIPAEFCDGPPEAPRIISIQAAFIRPEWTLVFCDHNVMITFHVMRLRGKVEEDDLKPGSQLWPLLWSKTHGPVHSHEPDAKVAALETWRREMVDTKDCTPIFLAMKATQTVFNGSGAQEATDQLQEAFISPLMPACQVCQSNSVWQRFKTVVLEYEATREALALPSSKLPYVSGPRPFRFNSNAHKLYHAFISTYRRSRVRFTKERLEMAHNLGLFDPQAIIQADGRAIAPPGGNSFFSAENYPPPVMLASELRTDRAQKKVFVPNYSVTIEGCTTYTPFVAQGPPEWKKVLSWSRVQTDVLDVLNKTTLGMYSFRVFVDQVWSAKRTADAPLPPRTVVLSGNSRSKRPLAPVIAKAAVRAKRKSENMIGADKENIDINEGRVTRAMKRQRNSQ